MATATVTLNPRPPLIIFCALLSSTEALVTDAVRHTSLSLSGAGWKLSSPPRVTGVPALVPNDIADDLERAGLLPDLWYGLNAMNRSKWLWEREWTLTLEFATPSLPDDGAAAMSWLAFDGVDYNCTVALNGQLVGSHVGAFEPFELDVSSVLIPPGSDGNNTVVLTLLPPPPFVLDELFPNSTTTLGYPTSNEGLDHCRVNREMLPWRSRLNFWDFATKHWSNGIWKHVALRQTVAAARLASNLKLRADLAAPYENASLTASVRWQMLRAVSTATSFRLRLSVVCLTDAAAATASTEVELPTNEDGGPWQTAQVKLHVRKPQLWWPSGYGEQSLYSVHASLLQCTHTTGCVEADEVVEPSFGFRELQALRNPLISSAPKHATWLYAQWGYPDPKGKPWILNSSDYKGAADPREWMLAVNGRRVFLRGGNWVPLDQMFGRGVREEGRMRAVLTLARDAGYTFLRVGACPLRIHPPTESPPTG